MILELLKENGIDEAKASEIVKAMADKKIYTTSLENADVRYNKVNEQRKELDNLVKEMQTQVTGLSKNKELSDELKKAYADLQVSHKNQTSEYEAKIQAMEFDYALDKTLSTAKCKNNKALKALLDMDSIKYQEGKLDGLESQIENLKQSDSYLFDIEEKPTNTGGIGGFPRGASEPTIKNSQSEFMNVIQNNSLRK